MKHRLFRNHILFFVHTLHNCFGNVIALLFESVLLILLKERFIAKAYYEKEIQNFYEF